MVRANSMPRAIANSKSTQTFADPIRSTKPRRSSSLYCCVVQTTYGAAREPTTTTTLFFVPLRALRNFVVILTRLP
jgi:hypothetical protein